MAQKTIMWGDGTADTLTVTYSGTVGSSTVSVESVPNITFSERTKVISLKAGGVTLATLTVTQKAHSRSYSAAYDNDYK